MPEPPRYYDGVGNVEEVDVEVVNGHAGGEHAAHAHDGQEHDDCDDCLAEAVEVTHTQELMFVLVGFSLSLLMVWLMMRRCKEHGADD